MTDFQDFKKKILQVAGGTAIAQAAGILFSFVLTRLYPPEQAGLYSVFQSMLGIAMVVSALRMELALPLPKVEQEAADVLVTALGSVFVFAAISSLVLLLFAGPILRWEKAPALRPFLWLLPLSLLGEGLNRVLTNWAVRRQAFKEVAVTKITRTFTQLLVQSGLGLLKVGPAGLMVGDAAGRMNGTWKLWQLPWKQDRERLRAVTWARMKAALHRYRRFPLFSTPTSFINALNMFLPAVLLARYYGLEVAGWYGWSIRLMSLPSSLVADSVSQVYFGEFARLHKEDPDGMMKLFKATVTKLFKIGLPLMALAGLGGWLLAPVVLGRDYAPAGFFMLLLVPMFISDFTNNCVGTTLAVLERQDLALGRELFRSAIVLPVIGVAKALGWGPTGALILYSVAGTLSYAAYGVVTWYAIHLDDRRRAEQPA